MPALSPTMTEGIINKWLVKVGDAVKAGDIIAEIETDKATMEVPSPSAGKVLAVMVKEGGKVGKGDAILKLAVAGYMMILSAQRENSICGEPGESSQEDNTL